MKYTNSTTVSCQYLVQTLIAMWRLVDSGATQFYLRFFDCRRHHVTGNFRLAFACPGPSIEHARRLLASHHTASTVNRGIERQFSVGIFDTFQNDRRFGHRSADETLLARKCRRCSFAHNPQFFSAVRFTPGEVMVIVNLFYD